MWVMAEDGSMTEEMMRENVWMTNTPLAAGGAGSQAEPASDAVQPETKGCTLQMQVEGSESVYWTREM